MDPRIVAINKAIKGKALDDARQGLRVGTHNVDFAVHIIGSIKVGEDGKTDVRNSVDWKAAFATAIGMLKNRCPDLEHDTLADLIGMIFRQNETATNFAAPFEAVIEHEEKRHTQVTGTKPKNGTVTTKLNCEFVSTPVVDIIATQRKVLNLA